MRRSSERILTTHVGSLIRPAPLLQFIGAKQRRQPYDEQAYQDCLKSSVSEIVARQAEVGIDTPSDGEFGKSISWSQYALERLSGFERRPVKPGAHPFARGADRARFLEFYAELDAASGPPATAGATADEAVCVAPITYTGQAEIQRDIANFKAALKAAGVAEGFLPVAAPASVIPDRRNEYYASDAECLHAIADAMRVEYRAIVDAGLLLQLDDARLAVTYDRMVPPAKFDDYRRWVALHVEALNHALEGIPEDRVRYHVCWGSSKRWCRARGLPAVNCGAETTCSSSSAAAGTARAGTQSRPRSDRSRERYKRWRRRGVRPDRAAAVVPRHRSAVWSFS